MIFVFAKKKDFVVSNTVYAEMQIHGKLMERRTTRTKVIPLCALMITQKFQVYITAKILEKEFQFDLVASLAFGLNTFDKSKFTSIIGYQKCYIFNFFSQVYLKHVVEQPKQLNYAENLYVGHLDVLLVHHFVVKVPYFQKKKVRMKFLFKSF